MIKRIQKLLKGNSKRTKLLKLIAGAGGLTGLGLLAKKAYNSRKIPDLEFRPAGLLGIPKGSTVTEVVDSIPRNVKDIEQMPKPSNVDDWNEFQYREQILKKRKGKVWSSK